GVVQQAGCTTAGGLDADASGNIICTPSREQFKNNIVDLNSGLSDILALRPVVYTFKPEMNMGSRTRFGFISEEVAAVASEFATYDKEGKPYGLDTNAILAETVKAIQEMNLNLDAIIGATIPLPESPSESFMTAFFGKLSAWLADARNEIGDVFANAFNAKEKICVDGECLTKDDVKALLLIARPISPELIPIPEPTPEPEPTPTPEPEPIPTAELAP
ncbi:MAG: LPXTG-motif cell wall anchor domain protein, partial [Candidatus Nomurabacteria bacterium GW2011_GWB1_40_7]